MSNSNETFDFHSIESFCLIVLIFKLCKLLFYKSDFGSHSLTVLKLKCEKLFN